MEKIVNEKLLKLKTARRRLFHLTKIQVKQVTVISGAATGGVL